MKAKTISMFYWFVFNFGRFLWCLQLNNLGWKFVMAGINGSALHAIKEKTKA